MVMVVGWNETYQTSEKKEEGEKIMEGKKGGGCKGEEVEKAAQSN